MAIVKTLPAILLLSLFTLLLLGSSHGFSSSSVVSPNKSGLSVAEWKSYRSTTLLHAASTDDDNQDDEAARMRQKAEELREQIRRMEEQLGDDRKRNYPAQPPVQVEPEPTITGMSLKKKRVLVAGANGRLGSMVCRYLLRNHPEIEELVACVHVVGENSDTSRGYGRLSYEVGAEDGAGYIGAAWSAEEQRVATFQYTDEMKTYNLKNLRIVECELLDPVQCETITENVDTVIWCATDFNGNKPRAISGLNVAFLFRALADPTKGRVEIEGLQNLLGGLRKNQQDRKWRAGGDGENAKANPNDAVNFVLVSTAPGAFEGFETPFGEFNGLKRQGERMVVEDFPSITHTILQMSKFEDNFVDEGLDVLTQDATEIIELDDQVLRRRINRRDAAKAAVDAITDESLAGKTVQVWTATR